MADTQNAIEALLAGGDASGLIAAVDADLKRRANMPKSPADLAMILDPNTFRRPPHIELLNKKLVQLAKREIKRLIVTMPPRFGKSEICSKFFPAWYLGTFPDHRVILASHGEGQAADYGGYVRNILSARGKDIFGVALDDSSKAKNNWMIQGRKGGMKCVGVGTGLAGKGASVFLVDDPFASMADAASKTTREMVWNWWMGDATTRLEPDGAFLVIHTRWNTDDLIGRLLEQEKELLKTDEKKERWHVVNFPAIAEEEDALGRKPGESLWPDRFPIDTLKQIRSEKANFIWSALYQQRPSPDSGEVFKREWFRYYKKSGEFYLMYDASMDKVLYTVAASKCNRIATMDVAVSDEQSADWTVLQVWDVTPSYDMVLVDQWRARKQSPDVIAQAAATVRRLGVQTLGVEKNGVGMGVYQALKGKSITVRPLIAKGDKRMRIQVAAQARMQAGMIYFPHGEQTYLPELERELLEFPKGKNDDQCDSTAHACQWVQDLGGPPRNIDDDNYDKELDKQLDAELSTPSLTERTGERIPQESTSGRLSDEAREWLKGGMPAWMQRAGRN